MLRLSCQHNFFLVQIVLELLLLSLYGVVFADGVFKRQLPFLKLILPGGNQLLEVFYLALTAQQGNRTALRGAAGHGPAGVHDVSRKGHQAESMSSRAHDRDTVLQVIGHNGPSEQVFNDAAVALVIGDQLAGNAQAARHGKDLALFRAQHPGTDAGDGQKGGAAQPVAPQVVDHVFGRLFILGNDVLKSAAQHHVDGRFQVLRYIDQPGQDAVNALILSGVFQRLFDGLLVARHFSGHFLQQLQTAFIGLKMQVFGLNLGVQVLRFAGIQEQLILKFRDSFRALVQRGLRFLLSGFILLLLLGQDLLLLFKLLNGCFELCSAVHHLSADGRLPGLPVTDVALPVDRGKDFRLMPVQRSFGGLLQGHQVLQDGLGAFGFLTKFFDIFPESCFVRTVRGGGGQRF